MHTAGTRRSDMRALWTLCGWGSAAALALLAAALTTISDPGSERLRLAAASTAMPEQAIVAIDEPARPTPKSDPLPRQAMPQQEQTAVKTTAIVRPELPPEITAETERLAATVRELAADRDRLRERLASLEQQLADVTGSIARDARATTPADPAKTAHGAAGTEPPAVPVLTPPVGMPPLGPDVVFAPEIASSKPDGSRRPAAGPWPQPGSTSDAVQPEASQLTPLAPPDAVPPTGQGEPAANAPVVEVPMPRMRVAAIPPKSEYAVDLGGAFSRETLVARWSELKVKFSSQLRGLRPLIGLESRFGYAPYRLVIGPLPDEAAAKQLCTRLSGKIDCRPAHFAGDRLAQH
jgi:hypothetical protein